MLPTAQKRLLCAALAALACLLSAGPVTAAPAPKIKAAYTADADRDGHVDAVTLQWSAKVRGGRDRKAPFAFSVKGYKVTAVAAARGRRQRISIAERRECDAGGSVRVAYRAPRKGPVVKPRKGRKRIGRHRVDMRRFDPPVPRITCAITLDRDGDARVDGVRLTYSRAVRSRAQRKGRFLFSVAGYKIKAVRAAKGRFLQIDLAERGRDDSGARPAVSYTRPARRSQRPYGVRAGRRGKAFSGSFLSTRDGVAPRLLAGRTADSDHDGLLDTVAVRFSEPVRGAGAPGLGVLGMPVRSVAFNGRDVALTLAEGSARTDARPGTWVNAGGVQDLSGNPALRGAVMPADGAQPVMTAAITADSGGRPGRLDTVLVGFSEPMAHARDGGGDYPFVVSGRTIASVEPASGRAVPLKLVEASAPDTGERPPVRLIPGAGLPLRDLAGNDAAAGFVNAFDAVAPVLLSGVTDDADDDGRIDAVTLSFSEAVEHAAEPAPSFEVAGYSATEAAAAQGQDIRVALNERAAGDSGATPAITYARDGVQDVRDAAGNATPDSSLGAALDGVAPVLLSARTADSDDDGRLDALVTDWSEPLDHADDQSAPFPVSASGPDVARVRAAEGQRLTIDLVEPSDSDTGSTPALTYSGGADPIRDAAGHEPQKRTWEGLTADALAPRLVSATTADADEDGALDSISLRYSEAVTHAQESNPASFSATGLTVTSAEAAAGATLELKVQETGANTGMRPAISYTPDGVEDVRDASANPAVAGTLAQTADGALPVLLSARTADADNDGRLDRIVTGWSEALDHPDDQTAPFSLSASGMQVTRIRAADGQNLTIDLVEPASEDTGSTPALTYSGGADPIRDAAGHEPRARTWAGLTRDALAPRLVSATTADADEDGALDSISLRYSEAVIHAREDAPGSFAATGLTVLSAEAATGTDIELKLQEAAGNTGLRPSITYTPDGQEDVRDASANLVGTATLAQAADGARPVMLSARTANDADADDADRLDRVATTWSEPLDHAGDAAAPFPVSVEQLAVLRTNATSTNALNIDLVKPAAPDTGSAPDVTYAGGAVPIRDAAGLEAKQRSYPGVTQDALPPQLISTGTDDADADGRLDGVVFEWSEQVTGATSTAPFAVAGRTLAANVVFNGARTRVPFTEDAGQFDTDATPVVSYDAVAGDLHDLAEGAGDAAEDTPAVAAQPALDKAPPILVAARTADLTTPPATNDPNGTIDAVLTTFSEPISHSVDGLAPFSLNVGGRTEKDIEGDTGPGDRTLYVRVNESSTPDGGDKPSVTVQSVGATADRIKDRAAVPNEARAMTFTGTTDEVRPVLVSAQLGERAGGECTKNPVAGIDGEVDCVLATWSEEVELAADASAPYSIQSSVWNVAAGGIAQLPPSRTLEIPLAATGVKDRDRSGTTVSYDQAIDMPVMDVASPPNESLSGSRTADPACRDTGLEGNDAQAPDNPALATTAPSFQRKCAFDEDWYTVETAAGDPDSGYIEMVTRPSLGIDVDFKLYDGAGIEIPAAETLETGGAGQVDRRRFTGLVPAATYHVRVTADEAVAPQEGPYCVVFSSDPAAEPGCGPLVGQIVFTEVGFGNDKFIEIKNDFDVPVEMEGAGAELILGPIATSRRCTLTLPTNPVNSVIDPNEHVLVLPAATATAFGCDKIPSLAPAGERLELSASGSIDVVDFDSIINSPIAAGHSLQFVEDDLTEDADANNDVAGRWCRTYAADTKGAVGDGCDEYRINEVLWKPTATSADANGKAFVELAGNIPALADSKLLGDWIIRGVNGTTGEGGDDFVLPSTASPRVNGTYVIADGAPGGTLVATSDSVWDALDMSSPQWPDATGSLGPRGIQLMRPEQAGNAPCTASADAFGWITAAEPFNRVVDNLRSCPTVEPAPYAVSTHGVSAARDNLATPSATSYNAANDTNNNNADFCAQPPNPGQLNTGRSC